MSLIIVTVLLAIGALIYCSLGLYLSVVTFKLQYNLAAVGKLDGDVKATASEWVLYISAISSLVPYIILGILLLQNY